MASSHWLPVDFQMQITLRCNLPSATFSSLVTNYTSKVWKTSQTEGFLTSPSYVTTLHDFPLIEEHPAPSDWDPGPIPMIEDYRTKERVRPQ